ncbi:MAG TPA: prephenate dehydrogenase/arogenate dehydrogenase family protein [Chloroflexota bacterium]
MAAGRRRLAIVGLGLIGGSLGLALKAADPDLEIVGHNRSPEAAGRARKIGAVDRAEWNLPRALEGAGIVVLAVAPAAMEKVMTEVAPSLEQGAVVTDVASTKVDVLAWAERILPEHTHFVGGHPMAGKEVAGIDAAEAGLFRGAIWCIVPGRRCRPEAVTAVEGIVRAVGARPYYLDAEEHDSYAAAISHLPFVASAALVNAVTIGPSWRDMARLAAGGFRDATRTASGDVRMHLDICRTNRDGIVRWLDAYLDELRRARELIASGADDEQLERFFAAAKNVRDEWLASRDRPPTAELAPPLPTAREGFGDLFFGRRRPRERR